MTNRHGLYQTVGLNQMKVQDLTNQTRILHGRDRRRILIDFPAKKESGKNRDKNVDLCSVF